MIEAFDRSKENVKFLLENPEVLNAFSEQISSIIPISIGSLSDRLGNIIFQFPITLFKIQTLILGQHQGLQINLAFNPKLSEEPVLKVIIQTSFDEAILDYVVQDIKSNTSLVMDASENIQLQVFNSKNNLIVYTENFTTIKNIEMYMGVVSPQDRFFSIDNIQHRVRTQHEETPTNIIRENDKGNHIWVNNRKYQQELSVLEQSKSFIQYKGNDKDRKKALNDIRELINTHGRDGVFLWDPYLSALDIKNTLYFCKSSNAQLKAITDINDTAAQIEEFKKDDKSYLRINLEVRKRNGNHGTKFHDRFLIFPLKKPRVWSLGTSINNIGSSHHILQEIQNAQHILNAFNELWAELNHERCLVWKST